MSIHAHTNKLITTHIRTNTLTSYGTYKPLAVQFGIQFYLLAQITVSYTLTTLDQFLTVLIL